jgi:hypothetical protein
VGTYRLLNRLGVGGMGRVYLGESPSGRMVAVKLIRPELADNPDFRRRFAHEVAAARQVSGVFTAPVVDADPDGSRPWLVTAYVAGPSLADAIGDFGPLPVPSVLALAAGLAAGLRTVHAAGIVHRDLKPSNVLLASDGPRIIDFGISRAADSTFRTITGNVIGSPGFMSPEQAEGREVGPATDIFSLGGVLAFAASGRPPFGAGSPSALLYRVVYSTAALGHVPTELRPLIERCLAKDPAERPGTEDLLAELGSAEPAADWLSRHASFLRPVSSLRATVAEAVAKAAPAHRDYDTPADSTRPARPVRYARYAQPWHTKAGVAGMAVALAVLAAASTAAITAALDHHSTGHPAADTLPVPRSDQEKHVVVTREPAPRTVVKAYIQAINRHDWAKVWRLGGDHMSPSFDSMVSGYARTVSDDIRSIWVRGDHVLVRLAAHESSGVVEVYRLVYLVRNGVIASGTVLAS